MKKNTQIATYIYVLVTSFSILFTLFTLNGCSNRDSVSRLMLDTRITEELGRARQTVEFVLELREQAVVNNQKELWFGFSERTALLASLLTSLSMERIEVLTSSTKKQSQFYKSVSPKVKTLERYRIALMTDALEKIDRELYSYSHKETIEVP